MEFRCAKKALVKTLTDVSKAAVKGPIPILEGVSIETGLDSVTLTCYNLEFGLTAIIPATVAQHGKAVITAGVLLGRAKKMTGDTLAITARTEEYPSSKEGDKPLLLHRIDLSDGFARFTISGMDAEDFPQMPGLGDVTELIVPQHTLKSMLGQTLYAVAKADTRPIQTGILFDLADGLLNLVSVDGYRLALRREKVESGGHISFVVPGPCVSSLAKLLNAKGGTNAEILTDGKYVAIEFGSYRAFSRLLDGEFMDYMGAIPKPSGKYSIFSVRELKSALGCAIQISGTGKNFLRIPLRMVFGPRKASMAIRSRNGEYFEEVGCNSHGIDDEITMGFNADKLMDCIKALDCNEVRAEVSSPLSPIKLLPVDNDGSFAHLLVPVLLKNEQAA